MALFMDGIVSFFTNQYERGVELFESCVEYVTVMHTMVPPTPILTALVTPLACQG